MICSRLQWPWWFHVSVYNMYVILADLEKRSLHTCTQTHTIWHNEYNSLQKGVTVVFLQGLTLLKFFLWKRKHSSLLFFRLSIYGVLPWTHCFNWQQCIHSVPKYKIHPSIHFLPLNPSVGSRSTRSYLNLKKSQTMHWTEYVKWEYMNK